MDFETPEGDAVEQAQAYEEAAEEATNEDRTELDLTLDANPADRAEQDIAVPDEDEYYPG
ncbi:MULTISPECIES: hypothetical protein [Actinopolyspora]|uniref:Uncharacterized protein n=1 Tax=Actinopolyspora saharensis TaxID=995062 RepID=A0A1H1A8J0_9ACTN|nr:MULTISPECIES: hypothetical protein [Actinopolyspora]NHD16890.1 hypothetical protein [Actinopolyspora sp. BKK2]NHE76042.1 hypothetical protein [Actinopolyspora sp. BKK1]SDQ36028.1 hypothetical protein SAMN04489718_1469 [Actinopolyspora saharensis]